MRQDLDLQEGWTGELPAEALAQLVPRFLDTALRLSDDTYFGLHAGESFHFCLAGAGGLAATHAPTPMLTLETFGRFVDGAGLISARKCLEDDVVTIALDITESWPPHTRQQVVEGVFSGLVTALREVCGVTAPPLALRMTATDESRRHALERSLSPAEPIEFGAERDELVLDRGAMSAPSGYSYPLLYEQLHFVANLASDGGTTDGPVRQVVEQAIRSGAHTIAEVSEIVGNSERTLQRRLQQEGAPFRTVLTEVRVQLAESLLERTELTISQIAERLGYNDDKALRKAFKSVTGKSPSEYRETH